MRRLRQENINSVFFLDIETVPQWEHLVDAPLHVQKEWVYKFKFAPEAPPKPDPEKNVNSEDPYFEEKYMQYFVDLWDKKAALHAEFSKIACISVGYIDQGVLKIKSYSNEKECDLLDSFANDLSSFSGAVRGAKMCAHYGKGFDYPFITKRLVIHRRPIPLLLDNYGLKPWEVLSLDTHEIWKIGSFSGSSGLSALAMSLGIPTPKDDIDGSDVARCYYNGELDRIVTYCEKDVITLVKVLQVLRNEEMIQDKNIQYIAL